MSRRTWHAIEALHGVVYFAPEAATVYGDVGLRGWWMGYFASRAAALGPVGPSPVVATFHGFAPSIVARALPAAWTLATVDDVLGVRLDLARLALGRALGDAALPDLAALVAACDPAGRPLAAAHAALPRPADAVGALWWDCTVLREHRGDGHVAALTVAGLDGCEANVLMRALGLVPERQQQVRGWTDAEWSSAAERLQRRGLLDSVGRVTDAGRALRDDVETATDRTCAAVDAVIDDAVIDDAVIDDAVSDSLLADSLVGLARLLATTGAVPYPNPVGVPSP